jgi:hypothetical protein
MNHGEYMQKAADEADATKLADAQSIENTLTSAKFSDAARSGIQRHRGLFRQALQLRRGLLVNGRLSDFVRAGLCHSPFQTLDADIEAACKELDAMFPTPANPLCGV